MTDQWPQLAEPIQSSDPDQVNDAIDQIEDLDADERARLFDVAFDDLATIYDESNDGYVRQSVVRVVDRLTPGLAAAVLLTESDEEGKDTTPADLERRLDTACGFLLETLQDEDGRVRQSAQRALKDVFRGYATLEDTETIEALVRELEQLAQQYEGKRREHLLDSKDDAAFLLNPAGSRLVESIQQMTDQQFDSEL